MKKIMIFLLLLAGLITNQQYLYADEAHIEEKLEKLRITPPSDIGSLLERLDDLTVVLRLSKPSRPLTPTNKECISALAMSTDVILTNLERMLEAPTSDETPFSIAEQLDILLDLDKYWEVLTKTNPEPLLPPSTRLAALFPAIIRHLVHQLHLIQEAAQQSYGLLTTITAPNESPFSFAHVQEDLEKIEAEAITEAINDFNKSFYGKGFHAYITEQLKDIEAPFRKNYELQHQLVTLSLQLHKAAIRINPEHRIFNVLTPTLIMINGSVNNVKSCREAAISENNKNFAPYAIYKLLKRAFVELNDIIQACKKGKPSITRRLSLQL